MDKEQELREALAFILSQRDISITSARMIAFKTLRKVYGPEWLSECPTFADVDKWMDAELERITALLVAVDKLQTAVERSK